MNNKSSVGFPKGNGSGKGPRKLDKDIARRKMLLELELRDLKQAEAEKAKTVIFEALPTPIKLASCVKVLERITYDPGSPIAWKSLAKELNEGVLLGYGVTTNEELKNYFNNTLKKYLSGVPSKDTLAWVCNEDNPVCILGAEALKTSHTHDQLDFDLRQLGVGDGVRNRHIYGDDKQPQQTKGNTAAKNGLASKAKRGLKYVEQNRDEFEDAGPITLWRVVNIGKREQDADVATWEDDDEEERGKFEQDPLDPPPPAPSGKAPKPSGSKSTGRGTSLFELHQDFSESGKDKGMGMALRPFVEREKQVCTWL